MLKLVRELSSLASADMAVRRGYEAKVLCDYDKLCEPVFQSHFIPIEAPIKPGSREVNTHSILLKY